MQTVQIISLAACLIILVVVVDFIRRGLLKEKYSILWLATIFIVIVFSLWKELLDKVADVTGVAYPPSLLFMVAFAFVLLLLLHFSVVISILTDKCKTLSQDIALLRAELKNKESGRGGGAENREGGDGG